MTAAHPPTHPRAGSNSARQRVGDPGHCERCAEIGHVRAHPDLGCGDVGCTAPHGPGEANDQPPRRSVYIDVSRDGLTGGMQLSIVAEDGCGCGTGYRLGGPKFSGTGERLMRVRIDAAGARKIGQYLDLIDTLCRECGAPADNVLVGVPVCDACFERLRPKPNTAPAATEMPH